MTTATVTTLDQLKASLPPAWPDDMLPAIARAVASSATRLVVLDDDPTGTQTVHGMPVRTTWSVDDLLAELQAPGPGFFVLTNSRSLGPAAAEALNREIGGNLKRAVAAAGVPVQVISRSDSTLRGHYPGEVDALMQALGAPDRPHILTPCFFEGGRYTAGDVHYVAEKAQLVPAAETPYARDKAFGYRHSNLRAWIAEKSGGSLSADRVASISLADIRTGGPDAVAERLLALSPGDRCVVNALEYRDLEVVTAGLLAAESRGGAFVFRSAASFVRVRAGLRPQALLDRQALTTNGDQGGLFVVGSYVPRTSAQLAILCAERSITAIEVKVDDLLDDTRRATAVDKATACANRALAAGSDTVVFTSRELREGVDAAGSLDIGRRVSDSLIAIVRGIECRPRYLVAKGGITSSDVATLGLGVRRAMIMGQALPGVPVWRLGGEARWPHMAYIVFPGNVGDDEALRVIRRRLARER